MKKIAIQGGKGCFHEQAARLFYEEPIEIVPCDTFEELFHKVSDKKADAMIMAIENTVAGGLLPNYSLLTKHQRPITGEVLLPIRQNLMALPGQRIEDLKEVHSHYMAIAQTRVFFEKYPHIRMVESADTALSAAEIAQEGIMGRGAIASTLAADLFELEILAESIETYKQNFTRFLVLDDDYKTETENIDKASICFTLPHQTGKLSHVLSIFAFYDLNLTKIQSLPLPGKEWQYFFYADLKFDNYHRYEEAMQAVRPLLQDIQIMGTYTSCKHTNN
ncbi:MAG: prephenate dehydratase [Marinifilaceae bacterium]